MYNVVIQISMLRIIYPMETRNGGHGTGFNQVFGWLNYFNNNAQRISKRNMSIVHALEGCRVEVHAWDAFVLRWGLLHSGLTLIALLLSHNRPGKWLLRFYGCGERKVQKLARCISFWKSMEMGSVYCGGVMQSEIFGVVTSGGNKLWSCLAQQFPFVINTGDFLCVLRTFKSSHKIELKLILSKL